MSAIMINKPMYVNTINTFPIQGMTIIYHIGAEL